MTSVYRGNACPDCNGDGRITECSVCDGSGTLVCDLCGGIGVRMAPTGDRMQSAQCICKSGYFTCATCSGGTGVCGRCSGTGFVQGK
jgi:hypothetical protein